MAFRDDVAAVAAAQTRLEQTVAGLTESDARGPSGLPGWSRGHLLTHLARNADGLNRMAAGVLSGESQEMYPGGQGARNAAIDEGADRPIALLRGDIEFAGRRLVDTLRAVPDDLLGASVAWRRPVTAAFLPVLRRRELELHHLDLAAGYGPRDWPADFVAETIAGELPILRQVAPDVAVPELPAAELLAWMAGRPQSAGLPQPPDWPFAPTRS